MSIYGKLETGHTDGFQLLLRLDETGIKELHRCLNRAFNTWEEAQGAPKDLRDALHELDKVVERMERRDEAATLSNPRG